jgi:hypothetical protein
MSAKKSNSTILNTGPDANLLVPNQEKLETTPAPSIPRSVPSQPENVSAQLEETRDTRRELELTSGEVHAAYVELNGQITLKLDSYIEQAVKAKDELEAMLPLVDQMQSMLSERGSQRKLMTTLGLPTWSEWCKDFRKRLHADITIRTIQRRLRAYREVPPANDVNVIAKESIRQLESTRQAERLEAAVEERMQLNPAIRQQLIRALETKGQKLLELAAKLKKAFVRCPSPKREKPISVSCVSTERRSPIRRLKKSESWRLISRKQGLSRFRMTPLRT